MKHGPGLLCVLLCTACLAAQPATTTGADEKMHNQEILSFDEFLESLPEPTDSSFRVRVTATPAAESPLAGRAYAYLEVVELYPDQATSIRFHSEDDLVFTLPDGRRVSIDTRHIRPYLAATAESKADGGVRLIEYAIAMNREYDARIAAERYHLPPAGPGQKPRTRTNHVLQISDTPFPARHPLTPYFQNWSY